MLKLILLLKVSIPTPSIYAYVLSEEFGPHSVTKPRDWREVVIPIQINTP